MSSKDYYRILEVSPSASTSDIKKSYRRLAHKFHPDKNSGNKILEAKFKELHEAYTVLSNQKKRQDYNLKRFDQLHGLTKKTQPHPVNASAILERSKELRKKIAQMDPDRMNRDRLNHQLQYLLSAYNIALLKSENNNAVNHQIIENVLNVSRHLPYNSSLKISNLLLSISGNDTNAHQLIQQFLKQQRLHSFWVKYKLLFALIIALLFCFLIYKIST
jgi:small-conductance mechanosensitive channel